MSILIRVRKKIFGDSKKELKALYNHALQIYRNTEDEKQKAQNEAGATKTLLTLTGYDVEDLVKQALTKAEELSKLAEEQKTEGSELLTKANFNSELSLQLQKAAKTMSPSEQK